MNIDDYFPPDPITNNGGLTIDRWLGAYIAQRILDEGSIYLCQTVPEFREAWGAFRDQVESNWDAFRDQVESNRDTLEGVLSQVNPPGWRGATPRMIRAAIVLFGDSTITDECQPLDVRAAAMYQTILEVVDALNDGTLNEDIIRNTIDKRLS